MHPGSGELKLLIVEMTEQVDRQRPKQHDCCSTPATGVLDFSCTITVMFREQKTTLVYEHIVWVRMTYIKSVTYVT